MTITVAVINESTVVTDTEVTAVAHALQKQVTNDFAPHWGTSARVHHYAHKPPPYAWPLVILDDSDQAGALGYHDVTPTGQPVGKVFAKTDADFGLSWTVTASHELLEILADPGCALGCQDGTSDRWIAQEVCDPCEADQFGYTIDGVAVSDFVLPSWFQRNTTGAHDFTGHLRLPLALLPGGYVSVWTPRDGWTMKTAEALPGVTSRAVRAQRIRRRQHELLKPSTAGRIAPDLTLDVV